MGGKNAFPERQAAPAPSTQAPSQPSNQATQNASPLKAIVAKESSPKQAFPERKRAPVPSSQGSISSVRNLQTAQSSSLKNVVAQATVSTNNAFPERKQAPQPSSQAPAPTAASLSKGRTGPSLKTIVAKDTVASTNAFPERKTAPPPSSQAPPQKQSASGDQAREGLTLRRYTQTRKASTSLGGLANASVDEAKEPPKPVPAAVNKAAAAAQSVPVSAKKEESARKPLAKSGSSFANLASLVGNGPVVNRDRSTVNQARSVSTKLGDIAKNPAAHRETGKEKEAVESKVATQTKTDGDAQEAFQRELLSKQLANDKSGDSKTSSNEKKAKKAQPSKNEDAVPGKGFSSLSAIIQGRDKRSITPTINKDRSKSSLFPEPSECVC